MGGMFDLFPALTVVNDFQPDRPSRNVGSVAVILAV
jgi:hypothetical protein